jgi:hypothetical protein
MVYARTAAFGQSRGIVRICGRCLIFPRKERRYRFKHDWGVGDAGTVSVKGGYSLSAFRLWPRRMLAAPRAWPASFSSSGIALADAQQDD